MTLTVLIGTAIVVIAAAVMLPMLLPGTREPATERALAAHRDDRNRASAQEPTATRLRPSLFERLRGMVGLVIVSAGLGAVIALAGAVVVLGLGSLLGQ